MRFQKRYWALWIVVIATVARADIIHAIGEVCQSNGIRTAGLGNTPDEYEGIDESILFCFDTNNGSEGWGPLRPRGGRYGPEAAALRHLPALPEGHRYAFMLCGRGGTAFGDEWNPQTGWLFQHAVGWFKARLDELRAQGHKVIFETMWVHIGETDSASALWANQFDENLTATIQWYRTTENANMAFVIAKVQPTDPVFASHNQTVREAMDAVAATLPGVYTFGMGDVPLLDDGSVIGDGLGVHLVPDNSGIFEVGRRFAENTPSL